MKVAAAVVVPAPPQRVWAELLAWEHQPAWMVDAASVRVVSATRAGPGTRIRVRTRILGFPLLTDVLEVTGWDPPRRLVMRRGGFVRGRGVWSLDEAGVGTRFIWEEELRVPIPLLGELALLLYRPVMRRLMRRSLANLASLMR